MARTLQQLKERIENLIEQQGKDAPVAAFIFTMEDVFRMNEEGEQVPFPVAVSEQVLNELEEYDYLYTEVFQCIDQELFGMGL